MHFLHMTALLQRVQPLSAPTQRRLITISLSAWSRNIAARVDVFRAEWFHSRTVLFRTKERAWIRLHAAGSECRQGGDEQRGKRCTRTGRCFHQKPPEPLAVRPGPPGPWPVTSI